jgi:hypothetical protein
MKLDITTYEQAFEGAKMMYEAKELSKEEYLNILKGFDTEKIVASGTDDYNRKQQLNKLITTTINALSMVA